MVVKNRFKHIASLLGLLIFLVLAVGSVDTDTKTVQSKTSLPKPDFIQLKTMTEKKINEYVSKEIMRDTYKLECLNFDKSHISYIVKFDFPIHYNSISPKTIGETAVQAIVDSVMDKGWKPQKEILGVYVRIYASSNEKSPTGKRLEYHYGKSVYDPVDDRIIWE